MRVLVVLILLLAGCGGPTPSPDGVWFVGEGGLVRTAGPDGWAPIDWSWAEYGRGDIPPGISTPPLGQAWQMEVAAFVGYFEPTKPTAPPSGSQPAFIAWLSVGDRFVARATEPGPPTMEPPFVAPVLFQFALPPGGVAVLPGERIAVHVGSQYGRDAGDAGIALTFGGERLSRLEVHGKPQAAPQGPWRPVLSYEGHSASCIDSLSNLSAPLANFTVGPDDHYVRAILTRGDGAGTLKDMDPLLYNATDVLAGQGASPGVGDKLILGPSNLDWAGHGTWGLRVWCRDQVAPLSVQVAVAS